jgi:branched-chain amino acid transport system ATP-binding protein
MAPASVTAHLDVQDLTVAFGQILAVRNVSLTVREGETLAVFGANGSGKTTFLKGIAGLLPLTRGRVVYRGEDLSKLPAHERAARGIRYVSDRARIAVRMTVRENLDAGAWLLPPARRETARARVLSLFPVLGEKAREPAGVLSGGERQMLILGRALIGEPALLLMDEPFLGLSREVRDRFVAVLEQTLKGRATILMAEHDAETAFRLLDRHVIFRNGVVVHEGTRAETGDARSLLALLHRHFRPGADDRPRNERRLQDVSRNREGK